MNYWERWIGDWKRKTAHLSLAEKGAYGELLDHQYAHNLHLLPLDHRALYRISGATSKDEWGAIDSIMGEFYEKTDAGYRNKRASEEITKRQNYAAGQAERANRRWHPAEPAAPVARKAHRGNGAKPPAGGFDEFWAAYPARNGSKLHKKEAGEQWAKIPAELREKVMLSVQHQAASKEWKRDNGGAVPDAFRWLRNKGFEDEVKEQPDSDFFPDGTRRLVI